jgi:hypothetical protein
LPALGVLGSIRNGRLDDIRQVGRVQLRQECRSRCARSSGPRPDKQEKAVGSVMKQAELLAADWAG